MRFVILSSSLLVISFPSHLKVRMSYQTEKGGGSNHLLIMEDMKLSRKSEDQTDSLVKTVQICCSDIGIEFDIFKCSVFNTKGGMETVCRGIYLPSEDSVSDSDRYKHSGILELDDTLHAEMKEKIKETHLKK